MSLWKKAVTGEVLMNGSGQVIECATCPCVVACAASSCASSNNCVNCCAGVSGKTPSMINVDFGTSFTPGLSACGCTAFASGFGWNSYRVTNFKFPYPFPTTMTLLNSSSAPCTWSSLYYATNIGTMTIAYYTDSGCANLFFQETISIPSTAVGLTRTATGWSFSINVVGAYRTYNIFSGSTAVSGKDCTTVPNITNSVPCGGSFDTYGNAIIQIATGAVGFYPCGCPSNCGECARTSYTVTFSGLTGNCSGYNNSYTVYQTGGTNACVWNFSGYFPGPMGSMSCIGSLGGVSDFGIYLQEAGPCTHTFAKDVLSPCPAGTYHSTTTGATAIVS